MADTYGKLALPVPVTSGVVPPVQAGGDPLVGYTADFLKAVLTAQCLTAWQQVAPTVPVVRTVKLDDPTDQDFNARDLPTLYVFRDEDIATQTTEWLACDYRYATSKIHVWWVMPNVAQATRAIRYAFLNAIDKAIDQAVERGRDPSWVVTGDTDPQAAASGSMLNRYAGWDVFERKKSRRKKLLIAPLDGAKMEFEMLAMEFGCDELLTRDITVGTVPHKLDVTYKSPDQGTGLGDRVLGEDIET